MRKKAHFPGARLWLLFSLSGLLTACWQATPSTLPSPALSEFTALPALSNPTLTTSPATPAPPQTPTPTPTGTATDPVGCRKPSDNYEIIIVNGYQLNQRTYEMLAYADSLYDGPIDITDTAITQGSYTTAVPESFHTHAGGGAVDLSVIEPGTFEVLYEEIEPLISALRLAGFAAWFRDFNDLYEGSPVHIHAIAIGDRDLSLAAREQLAGPHGYFWGYDGLPVEDRVPERDPHGGPMICGWMLELGYPNKTATPSP